MSQNLSAFWLFPLNKHAKSSLLLCIQRLQIELRSPFWSKTILHIHIKVWFMWKNYYLLINFIRQKCRHSQTHAHYLLQMFVSFYQLFTILTVFCKPRWKILRNLPSTEKVDAQILMPLAYNFSWLCLWFEIVDGS